MNAEAVKNEIAAVAATVRAGRQYPVAKHQINTLTELGIIDLMPVGFGYQTAARVIEVAQQSGKDVGGFNAVGEGDVVRQGASALYTLINERTSEPSNEEIMLALTKLEVFEQENFQEQGKLTFHTYAASVAREMWEGEEDEDTRKTNMRAEYNKITAALKAGVSAHSEGYRLARTRKTQDVTLGMPVPANALAWRHEASGHVATSEHYRLLYLVKEEAEALV